MGEGRGTVMTAPVAAAPSTADTCAGATPSAAGRVLRAEIAVVVSAPGGIAAGSRAAEAGRDVVVVDASPRAGGPVRPERRVRAPHAPARAWRRADHRSGGA